MAERFLLSPEEKSIVTNAGFFYTKHRIIEKVYLLFGNLSKKYGAMLTAFPAFLPEEVSLIPAKIYRGENYRELPYVMLDHPRFFKPQEAFAIRSLFWWGQHFSIHLVLGGAFASRYQKIIMHRMTEGLSADWHYSITHDPWQHHFEAGNYTPVNESKMDNAGLNESAGYIKLARKMPLDRWEEAEVFFTDSFSQLISMLAEEGGPGQEKSSLSR